MALPRVPHPLTPHAPAATARWSRWGTTLTCLAMAIGAVLPVLGLDGWPDNHEFLSLFERAEGFRRAFAAGDFFPLWTPFCFNGHGSPWPFFYHRLFNTLSGGLGWMWGSAYQGTRFALVLVLFVGATGAASAARRLGASSRVQKFAAFLLCFSQYAFFDWLVRGAAAELSAMMLYPWLLWACLRLLSDGRGGLIVGLCFTLLFYAHTVMFLYALPTVALVLGFVLTQRGWRPTLTAAGLAALPVLTLCAPYALLLMRLEKSFNTAALGMFTPDTQFVKLGHYLWDSRFHWGRQWEGVTPEIGPALLASLAVLAALARLERDRPPRGQAHALRFLSLTAAFYALLQLPLAAAFYRGVPFAALLQFPWRLVGFLTPLLVLLWSALAEEFLRWDGWRRELARAARVLPLGAGLLFGWKATHPHYGFTPRASLEEQLTRLDQPWSGQEYRPRHVLGTDIAPPMPFISQRGCARVTAEPARALEQPLHFHRVLLSVSSPEGCTASFNQFQTPFLAAESSGPARFITTQAGTLDIHLPPGEHLVELRRRGFFELLVREF